MNGINIKFSGKSDNISQKNCVIGLDRDGTLNRLQEHYVTNANEWIPIPGSLEAVAKLRHNGYSIVILSNQGGIEKGIMTIDDVDAVHEKMFSLLGQAGCASIDALYYSASDKKNNMFAKPNLGMFKRCERENPHIKFKGGYFVGDRICDLKAAFKVGATPVLVRTGHGLTTEKQITKTFKKFHQSQILIFNNLQDFADDICD